MKLSVVIPVFNESENLESLTGALQKVLEESKEDYEIIFVDDASQDPSFSLLERMAAASPRVKVVQLRRNCGQTAALMAGINHSRGEIVITMDGDFQNDPADIPLLIAKLAEGYDMVSGWRERRNDSYLFRVVPSYFANKLISALLGVPLHDYGCTLKAYRGSMLREQKLYGEMHRFIPIYMAWEGARIAEIPVRHHPRKFGTSKYGLSRIYKVSLDLMMLKFLESYSTKPIHVFGGFGLLLSGFGFLLALSGPLLLIPRAGLMGGVFMIMGFQFLFLGILAELIIRTYHESTERTIYKIRRKINLEDS